MAIFEGVTDVVKIKALMKALSKGAKEVITKKVRKGKTGWSEQWIKELFN